MISRASAPGKIILTGEHSVVYGYPAIALALDLRVTVTMELTNDGILTISSDQFGLEESCLIKDTPQSGIYENIFLLIQGIIESEKLEIGFQGIRVQISSDLPIGAGLGSSAAVSVAATTALLQLFSRKISEVIVSKHAFASEELYHGTPSGIDNGISYHGGVLRFEKGKLTHIQTKNLDLPLAIINTKIPRSTKTLVSGVRKRFEEHEEEIGAILKTIGNYTERIISTLDSGHFSTLGQLMYENHFLLNAIGVGHATLDELVWLTKQYHALGAKLTGAGGGGCLLVLLSEGSNISGLQEEVEQRGYDFILTSFSPTGVEYEVISDA